MRKILFLLLLISSFSSYSQYDDKWKEVYNYELDGKIKSAEEKVQEIYKKAKRKKDEVQIVKCFFYLSKFEQVFDEKAQTTIITNLQDEIRTAKPVSKALLNYIYATILEKYYQKFSYQISKLTPLKNQKSKDFLIWSSSDFEKEIEKTYALCIEDEEILRATFLNSYKDIFEISHAVDAKNFSIYDFISQKCIAYYKTKLNNKYWNKTLVYPADITPFYEQSDVFLLQNADAINVKELKNLVRILQNNEKYYYPNNQDKIDEKYYERLKIFNGIFADYNLFYGKINELEKRTNNLFIKQYLRIDRVKHYQSRSFKNDNKNLNEKALKLIDTILETKVNLDALATAENIKIEIHKKSIYLELPKITYPNQNNRAYIRYKNVDTISISFYPLPHKLNYLFEENYYRNNMFYKDSIVNDLINKNKALKKQIVKLPNKNDYYETSTEFLLDKLEVGNYLVYIEASNHSNLDKNAFAYQRLQVTDLFVFEDDEENKDVFYTYNRKTGKPIENIKFKNEVESTLSNSIGKASLNPTKHEKDVLYNYNVEITHQKDTIIKRYNRNFIYSNDVKNEDYENFEAKAMVYFDRAIYRPGQKMYYKGIIIQNLNDEKSVVPFVSVRVTIEDENNSVLKEFDLQTNEFGSFSGEFDIPKNVLTGEFSIEIDEPENYKIDEKYYDKDEEEHKFWDNVDFNSHESFRFNVEEYKRPTFEVNFDEIKENYTIGDTLKIKGNAKALAGNNLTNAKVTYSITKSIYSDFDDVDFDSYQKNYINKEITTDENGNFLIEFTATDSILSNEKINALNFNIEAVITDTNGETRSAFQEVVVGKKMLQLNLHFKNYLIVEENNVLKINATTLNNYPIDTQGTIKIYGIQQKKFLKNNTFNFPEIRAFTREEFERLFPHEAYDESDYKTKDVLVKTILFDTKNSKEINLDFLRNYKTSKFKIITEAYDAKNNLIKIENELNVISKKEPFSDEKLFTIKDISEQNSNLYTIEIQSIIPDLYITSRFYIDEKLANSVQTIQLNNGKAIFKFPKTNDYKDKLTFYFVSVWENLMHQEFHRIKQETAENKLNIEIESYRNKIEPGSVENWSFKILNQKLEAEVLASMYDKSLDQFVTDGWKNILFYYAKNYYPTTPTTTNEYPFTSIRLNNFIDVKKRYFNTRTNTDLNWFGFDFTNPKNEYVINNYYNNIKTKTRIPKNAKFIIGIVVDDLGPVAGANVNVHGTDRGTVTNFDGEFEIEAAKGETLLIQYAGSSEMVLVDNRKDYTITLKSVELIDSVVVTALGIKRENKLLITKTTEINVIDTSLNNALSGKVSGLQINQDPSTFKSVQVVLRGFRSVTNENNNAIIVIDGVVVSNDDFDKLDPNDIQDITVLKSSDAMIIYGASASNGALIVTTKNALKELTQVKTRTNFNETAFFYPNLKTDNNGKVSFNFTTPESLTQWKLRLYAHNKKTETGYFESIIISQKDVMVQTNMPRFLRENDTINISAKIVNMTNETKSGVAMLLLYDAATMKPVDNITLNTNNTRNFSCKPKESVPVNWKITIPEGLQGLQYKIVAKSGNFSDGEENILPVLSNKILITESIPIWVKGNAKKEYAFENLKNNDSKTSKNHLFTLEYTSNPVWFALQSLPYLMEYEHECAEQTFSRYYANFIATEIINSNPKIASLFESWKNNPKAVSKLTQNDELKSIVLNETPWLLDAENDDQKNKRLSLLMDLNTMKESQEKTLKKLEEKQKSSGGFAWFDGGNENDYITQHIVAGLGHLEKMFPQDSSKFEGIISKAIPYLDANFIKTNTSKNERVSYFYYSNLHFLYARSFHLDKMPISKKMDSIINIQKKEYKANWLNYSLYQKGLLALTMNRFGDKKFAEKIISNLKETVARNDDFGMYWIENKNGYYWYQSPIETQALLIEAFAEIEKDNKYVDEMKVWLLKNKQVNKWSTTKATSEAIYALLLKGTDWTSIKDNTKFKIGNEKILTKKLSEKDKDATTGYIKMNWSATEISKEMGTISVENKTEVPGYGSVYWQYFENLENVKSDSTKVLSITKSVYKKIKTTSGNELVELSKENLKPGDLVTIQLIIKTENDLEFVHLKDLRASCFEPVDVISEYKWKSGLSYYQSTKDVATHFFFDTIRKGTYVLEYDVRINNSGSFNDGIATLQSMYAPEFTGHSTSTSLKIQD